MDEDPRSTETVGDTKSVFVQNPQSLKHPDGEGNMAEADMNANIEAVENQAPLEPETSDKFTGEDPLSEKDREKLSEMTSDDRRESPLEGESDENGERDKQVLSNVEGQVEHQPDAVENAEDTSPNGEFLQTAPDEMAYEQQGQSTGEVEDGEEPVDTPTVVVATAGEDGQYEIHMVGSELRELTEGLPEGTQLMTEDGQLIHAVQEDEHGNMVMLANPLSEIHTMDEQTGDSIYTGDSEIVEHELSENAQEEEQNFVTESTAEPEVSYVQEEMLEQHSDVVMLGEDVGYIVTEGESEEIIVGEAPTLEVCAETEVGTSGVDVSSTYTDDSMLEKYVPEEGQVVVERIGYQVPEIAQRSEHEVVHHEEYIDEDDEEIGFQEDVVISESNHTIPNDEEANEIRMLTEAANNSLRTMEEHFNPPKKRPPRRRKVEGEGVVDGSRPRKRRRPPTLYFNEQGEPFPGRARALLEGLENLNLPVATAGTAPISPPEPEPPQPRFPFRPDVRPQAAVAQHTMRMQSPTMPFPPPAYRERTLQKPLPELSIPMPRAHQMMSPGMRSPGMSSPQMMMQRSPQVSPRMLSPGQQTAQLSPRSKSMTQKKHPLLSSMLSPGAQGATSNVSPPCGMVSPLNQMVRMPRNVAPVSFPFPPRPNAQPHTQVTPNTPALPSPVARPLFSPQQPGAPQIVPPPSAPPLASPGQLALQQIARAQAPLLPPASRPERPPVYPVPPQAAHQTLQNVPRFQQMISGIPPQRQPVQAQPPPVNPVAVQPSESPVVGSLPQQAVPHTPHGEVLPISQEPVAPAVSSAPHIDQSSNEETSEEPRPKIQDLIKSELLAAAWESRQPKPSVPQPEKVIQKPTIANTISRVEEQLRKVASEAPKSKAAVNLSLEQVQAPKYSSVMSSPVLYRPTVPSDALRMPAARPPMGSTLPPISTLQTKLPPGLVPSTLSMPSSSGGQQTHISAGTAVSASTVRPPAVSPLQPAMPPVNLDKQTTAVVPGQAPGSKGLLSSPLTPAVLAKDLVPSGRSLTAVSSTVQQTTPQPSTDGMRNASAAPAAVARLPAPFPLAFAPGLPPVGLMMQPLPLGLARPGMLPQVSMNGSPGSAGSVLSVPQLRGPVGGHPKPAQGPAGNQMNPLDLIAEVMKKEAAANPQALLQGQPQKDVKPGVLPSSSQAQNEKAASQLRFPIPGPTMEMLIAIMQREVAAAQIQAQVAAMHAAHAQAQVQEAAGQKAAVSAVRPTLTEAQVAQLQPSAPPAPAAQPAPVRAPLPPVSTVMPVNSWSARPPVSKPAASVVAPSHTAPAPAIPAASNPGQPQVPVKDVQTTSNALPVQRNVAGASDSDTLADKYMKEWKPTGRFQCKFCHYSCVTQNFLFRHWVMNHCCMKPYLCGYCGLKSPTRDGITRHQTAKHKGQPRQVVIDAIQEGTLIQNFKALFNLDVKEIHPEDIRRDSVEGLVFPETYDPRSEKKSPGASNGETDLLPSMADFNLAVKNDRMGLESQNIPFHPPNNLAQNVNTSQFEPLPPHLREHFLATSTVGSGVEEKGDKTADYLKRHHKKSMIDSVGMSNKGNGEPLSKEQLQAMAVAQVAEIDRSIALGQTNSNNEAQRLPSIAEIRKDPALPVPGTGNVNNTLPSIRDLIQMPRGQILAMTGLGTSASLPHLTPPPPPPISSAPVFSQSGGNTFQHQHMAPQAAVQSGSLPDPPHFSGVNAGGVQSSSGVDPVQEDRPVLPAGVVVPRLTVQSKPAGKVSSATESEAHQAAAQLVSMANSRHPGSTRHMTPPLADQNHHVAAMVSNVAAGAEQQKAALSIEHEVAAQLEDFAKRKAVNSGKSPPATVRSSQPVPGHTTTTTAAPVPGVVPQKELSIDEQVALQLEEFRRRKAVIEAREATKPKKSPRAKTKRSNVASSSSVNLAEQRHLGSNSVNEVVAQLHQMAQKRQEDQARGMPSEQPSSAGGNQVLLSQSAIDEQRLLATQLEELAQKRAAAIQAAIRAQAQERSPSPVVEREVATQLAELSVADFQQRRQQIESAVKIPPVVPVEQQRGTMYDLYERAVVESYESSSTSGDKEMNRATTGISHVNTQETLASLDRAAIESVSGLSSVPPNGLSVDSAFDEGQRNENTTVSSNLSQNEQTAVPREPTVEAAVPSVKEADDQTGQRKDSASNTGTSVKDNSSEPAGSSCNERPTAPSSNFVANASPTARNTNSAADMETTFVGKSEDADASSVMPSAEKADQPVVASVQHKISRNSGPVESAPQDPTGSDVSNQLGTGQGGDVPASVDQRTSDHILNEN